MLHIADFLIMSKRVEALHQLFHDIWMTFLELVSECSLLDSKIDISSFCIVNNNK